MCNMKSISYFFAFAALFMSSLAAFAQEQGTSKVEYESSEELYEMMEAPKQLYKGDFFVGLGGGPSIYFGEHDRQMLLKHRLAPAMDVYAGKWITPYLAVRLSYSGGRAFGLSNIWYGNIFSTGTQYPYPKNDVWFMEWQEFDYFGIRADVMLNLITLLAGDNPDRFYDIIPYVGAGVDKVYNTPLEETCVGISVGIFNTFRIADSWDIVLDVHGTAVPEKFEHETGVRPGKKANGLYAFDGILTASLGVAYTF